MNYPVAASFKFEIENIILIVVLAALCYVAYRFGGRLANSLVGRLARRTRTGLDDALVARGVFKRLALLGPGIVIFAALRFHALEYLGWLAADEMVRGLTLIYMIAVGLYAADALLNAAVDVGRSSSAYGRMPLKAFAQVGKIVLYLTGSIWIVSVFIGKSPLVLLSGLTAITAVLLLVFLDSLLGLVAGVQMAANDTVKTGDWIEMPKYDANGEVIDVALTTIKVRNWDNTITMIPTYALISDSFKNWRGMFEMGGRRIMRSVLVDMRTIRFCTPKMVERFRKFQLIAGYIDAKTEEIEEWNHEHEVDESEPLNGRRLTNIGVFRAYVQAYLHAHPKIRSDMLRIVRQLEPTERGLPIQLYVFSSDVAWADYEAIQADIFDHLLAVLPEFDLGVFQNPSGADFRALMEERPRGRRQTSGGKQRPASEPKKR